MQPPVVIATSHRLDIAPELVDVADVLEIRLDLGEVSTGSIKGYEGQLPVLLTNRIGKDVDDPAAIVAELEPLIETVHTDHVWGIDLDRHLFDAEHDPSVRSATEELVATATDSDVTTICSMHPDAVPPVDWMVDHLREAAEVADIAKLAISADEPTQLEPLIRATAMVTDEMPVTTMATGRLGLVSRAIAVGLGVQLVYGAPPTESVVEGQPNVESLRTLVDAYHG